MALLNFNANDVPPAEDFGAIKAGDYLVQVIKSSIDAAQSGKGQLLNLEMEILDGEYQGQHLWKRINVLHESQQAQEIGQRELSALCHAVGKINVADSEELHFIPVIVGVKFFPAGHVRKGKNGREDYIYQKDTNECGNFKVASGSQIVNGVQSQQQSRQTVQQPAQSAMQRPSTMTQQQRPAASAATTAAGGRTPPWGARRTAA